MALANGRSKLIKAASLGISIILFWLYRLKFYTVIFSVKRGIIHHFQTICLVNDARKYDRFI